MNYRIGFGYDSHRLVRGRKLIIGGVEVPFAYGLFGHSDADCLLHAITDSILGAIGAGDIGELFPDTDPKYKGADSAKLLKQVVLLAKKKGYTVGNVDSVVILEKPKLLKYKILIKEKIAQILGIEKSCVSVKAKTNEGLGVIGKGLAMASYAVILLNKKARR